VADSSAICHISDATLYLPFSIGDFTDFSCSLNHVLNASEAIFKKREAPPAFHHFPVGYTGRTSSIVVSGTPVIRPNGQYRDADGNIVFGPSKRLDYELEVGAFICKPSEMGKPVSLKDAEDHIFGVVLLNDWSARDIQALEMNPLGPLNGKSFCTTISPWVITLEALAPFKVPGPARNQDVELANYLQPGSTTYDFELSAELKLNGSSRQSGSDIGFTICQSHFSCLYWTLADLIAQQTVNGCNLNVGDLLATGTISGDSEEKRGCLMESPSGIVGTGSDRATDRIKSLDDGVTITLTGKAGNGVGFGDCTGTVQPAIVYPK
jgi:fumarylacetoacetase